MSDLRQRPTPAPLERLGPPPPRTLFGKPLVWTGAWTAVVLVWAVSAAGLVAVRLDMGRLPVLNARERAAIAAVEQAEFEPGVPFAQPLSYAVAWLGGADPRPVWYVQDRPWEGRTYVGWELDDRVRLSWTVGEDGEVRAGAETTAFLQRVMAAGPPARAPAAPTGLPGS